MPRRLNPYDAVHAPRPVPLLLHPVPRCAELQADYPPARRRQPKSMYVSTTFDTTFLAASWGTIEAGQSSRSSQENTNL